MGAIALHITVFWVVREQAIRGIPDFGIFYTASLILRRGEAHRMYDGELQKEIQMEFAPLSGRDRALPYNHAPFEALPFIPLGYLPYFPAYLVWDGLNILLLVEIGRFLRPHVPELTRFLPQWPWLVGLAFFPAAYALMQGQDSIVSLLLYSLAYLSLKSGKDFKAGVLLGLGLYKFHFVLPFIFILFLRKMWRAVAGFALCGAALLLLSVWLVGIKEILYYPHFVWQINLARVEWILVPRNMPNLRGLIVGWPGVPVKPWVDAIVMVVSLAFLVWAASKWNASSPKHDHAWDAGFCVAVVATCLCSYHGYNQDMTIILLPALLLFDQWLGRREDSRLYKALAGCLALLFCTPVYLLLALNFHHQNLFSLVLVTLAVVAAKISTGQQHSAAPAEAAWA
ncbi:MAG TPA: glycosyltransferase family 87 protein [Terriglobales bacterium]|nr:glycosyltransferase family 87 protein [Terriglobales bacterium]